MADEFKMDELYAKIHKSVIQLLPMRLFHINILDQAAGEIVVPYLYIK